MDHKNGRWMLHAPNLHTGGGLTLLRLLVDAMPAQLRHIQCDARVRGKVDFPADVQVTYVAPTVWSRLCAEWRLRAMMHAEDGILCMHNLPPLFACKARAVVFVHNRLLVSDDSLEDYPWRTGLRLRVERLWLRTLSHHAALFMVQTESMASALRKTLGSAVPVEICPFAPVIEKTPHATSPAYDYIYPAAGDAHKNHATLLMAWQHLARSGITPSLVLTVDPLRYPELAQEIEQLTREQGLNITNLGSLAPSEMAQLYQSARALIFPSRTESLGLPLLEAQSYGLPILAAERDYVRDIVTPTETFDPDSALSIARAVMRSEGRSMLTATMQGASEFWHGLFGFSNNR